MSKKLYRSSNDHVIAGIAGGVGEYFGIDPNIVRLGLLLTMVFGGGGIVAYVVGWIIIPPQPGDGGESTMFIRSEVWRKRLMNKASQVEAHLQGRGSEPAAHSDTPEELNTGRQQVGGIILIAVGIFMLVNRVFPWINVVAWMWPFVIVGLGVILIVRGLHE